MFLCMRDRVDEDAILAEVDHGESYLAGKWQAALAEDELTADTRQLINGCFVSIQRGHEEWRRTHLDSSGAGSSVGEAFEMAGEPQARRVQPRKVASELALIQPKLRPPHSHHNGP